MGESVNEYFAMQASFTRPRLHLFTEPISLLAQDPLFVRGNQAEAAVWWLIAAVFAWCAWSQTGVKRRQCLQALVVFFAFGLSDLVEIRTGAWWRPWWLLLWKTACVVAMVWLLWSTRKKGSEGAGERGSEEESAAESEGTGNTEPGTD